MRLKPSTTSTPACAPAVTRGTRYGELSDSPPALVAQTRKKIVAPAFRLVMTLFVALAPGTAIGLPEAAPVRRGVQEEALRQAAAGRVARRHRHDTVNAPLPELTALRLTGRSGAAALVSAAGVVAAQVLDNPARGGARQPLAAGGRLQHRAVVRVVVGDLLIVVHLEEHAGIVDLAIGAAI